MTMARYSGVVQDQAGNIIPNAKIEVRRETPGAPLAAIKEDRDGLVALTNPFNAADDGGFFFHVVGGFYKIRAYTGASGAPTYEKILRYVPIGELQGYDLDALLVGKRQQVRVATTANITIATALNNGDSIDGVTLATSDLVLVKDQTSKAENGVYVVGVSPARSAEFDTYNEHAGAMVAVVEGTAGAGSVWFCTANVGGILDTTAIEFTELATTAGERGPPGPALQPDQVVPLIADRAAYDGEAGNFCVLVESDSTNDDLPTIYFKLSAASGDWTDGFTFAQRELIAPAAGFTISNADGTTGNPTFALSDDLAGLEALSGTGLVVRTAAETYDERAIVGTSGEVTVTNGDGVSGNPTVTLPATMTGAKTWNAQQVYKQTIIIDFKSTGSVPSMAPGAGLQVVGVDGAHAALGLECFGAGTGIVYARHAAGTNGSKTATQLNTTIIQFLAYGYGATNYSAGSRGKFAIRAAENFTDTAQGTYITLESAALGATALSEAIRAQGTAAYFTNAATTASAANAFLDTGSAPANELKRSTSSIRYKRNVQPVEEKYSAAILNLQPVWYQSQCAGDNKEWGWWGLIAEDVAKVDPRLVHFGYQETDYEVLEIREESFVEEVVENKGQTQVKRIPIIESRMERRLKLGAVKVPDGVQYERLNVLLLDQVQRLIARVDLLEKQRDSG